MLEATLDNVLLEIVTIADHQAREVKERSGLLVSTVNVKQAQPNQGIVCSLGPDVPVDKSAYTIGDMVIFNLGEIFQGFEYEGKKLLSVRHEEIIAKMEAS